MIPAIQEHAAAPKEGPARAAGEVLLPGFISKTAQGLMVDTTKGNAEDVLHFIDRVFNSNAFLYHLNYATMQALIYGEDKRPQGVVRLAEAVKVFEAERRPLYRAVKIALDGSEAEYFFESVSLEIVERLPVYGPPDEQGHAEVTGFQEMTRSVPAKLDFDEFVADMWLKGVRFGLLEAAVRGVIERGETARMTIAYWRPPTPGKDATLEELTNALHRDDSPFILPDGRVDLRRFKNRYPQVAKGEPLLRKVPPVLGVAGFKVSGERIEPPMPKDFDLAKVAGAGTKIVTGEGGEFIISEQDGFLNLDPKTQQVSITEKIVSRQGVSIRTTGDLALTGDEFEEHGDVQEERSVEGKHMTFFGNVYGRIVSSGGKVLFKGNIAGGEAISPGGEIRCENRVLRARLLAPGGEVFAGTTEGSHIVAGKVVLEKAIACEIIAEVIDIAVVEGCAIAGREIKLGSSRNFRNSETIVCLLLPDLAPWDHALAELANKMKEAEGMIQARVRQIEQLRGQPDFASFLALEAKLKSGKVKLTVQQDEALARAAIRFATPLRQLRTLQAELAAAGEQLKALHDEHTALAERRKHAGEGTRCQIAEVRGDTLVRRLKYDPNRPVLSESQLAEIAAQVREYGPAGDRLFWSERGTFEWNSGA